MKLLRLLTTCTWFTMSFTVALGQNDDDKKSLLKHSSPFASGKNSFSFIQNGYFSSSTTKVNNNVVNKSNTLLADLEWNHWFKGGFGAGLSFSGSWIGDHRNTHDHLERKWAISPTLSYGLSLASDKLYGYLRVGATFGGNTFIEKDPVINVFETKADLSGYNIVAGFPLRIVDNSFLTGRVFYNRNTSKNEQGKERIKGLGVSLNLENYLRCNEIGCDHRKKYTMSKNAYDQGSSFIDYSSGIKATFFKGKQTYFSFPDMYDNIYNNTSVNAGYTFYFIDYLAIGADISLENSDKEFFDAKQNNTSFNIGPKLTLNVPVDNGWRNVFFRGGLSFQTNKNKSEMGTISIVSRYAGTELTGGLGINHFFEEHTALETFFGYRHLTVKNKDSEAKSTTSGIFVSAGLKLSF